MFAVDSLGQGKLDQNPILPETKALADLELDGWTHKLNVNPNASKLVWKASRALQIPIVGMGGIQKSEGE